MYFANLVFECIWSHTRCHFPQPSNSSTPDLFSSFPSEVWLVCYCKAQQWHIRVQALQGPEMMSWDLQPAGAHLVAVSCEWDCSRSGRKATGDDVRTGSTDLRRPWFYHIFFRWWLLLMSAATTEILCLGECENVWEDVPVPNVKTDCCFVTGQSKSVTDLPAVPWWVWVRWSVFGCTMLYQFNPIYSILYHIISFIVSVRPLSHRWNSLCKASCNSTFLVQGTPASWWSKSWWRWISFHGWFYTCLFRQTIEIIDMSVCTPAPESFG